MLLLQKRYKLKKVSLIKSVLFPILLWYVLISFINIILTVVFKTLSLDNLMLFSVLSSGISALVIIFLYKNKLPFDRKLNAKKTLLCVLLMVGLYAFVISILNILDVTKYFPNYNNLIEQIQNIPKIIYFLCVIIFAPIGEEVLFRGVIYTGLKSRMKIGYAIILQAFLFDLIHGNFLQGSYAFIIGIILALILEYTENIFVNFLCHITFNICNDLFKVFPLNYLMTNNLVLLCFGLIIILTCSYFMLKDVKS